MRKVVLDQRFSGPRPFLTTAASDFDRFTSRRSAAQHELMGALREDAPVLALPRHPAVMVSERLAVHRRSCAA
jgi:hypothetical protein